MTWNMSAGVAGTYSYRWWCTTSSSVGGTYTLVLVNIIPAHGGDLYSLVMVKIFHGVDKINSLFFVLKKNFSSSSVDEPYILVLLKKFLQF